jgi:hypothetical protein
VAFFSVLPRAFRPRLSILWRDIVAVFEGFAIVASLTPRIAQPQTPRLVLCCSLVGQRRIGVAAEAALVACSLTAAVFNLWHDGFLLHLTGGYDWHAPKTA